MRAAAPVMARLSKHLTGFGSDTDLRKADIDGCRPLPPVGGQRLPQHPRQVDSEVLQKPFRYAVDRHDGFGVSVQGSAYPHSRAPGAPCPGWSSNGRCAEFCMAGGGHYGVKHQPPHGALRREFLGQRLMRNTHIAL